MLQYVIVVDDEDRENEGDLIMAASKVTPEAMAFIVRHGTGIVCVSMKEEDLERLQLPLMVTTKENEEKQLPSLFQWYGFFLFSPFLFCRIRTLA
jgi:3,4-dihydroxy 2-butanone 4-phosphate synthase/GTP cyclohydrolase II